MSVAEITPRGEGFERTPPHDIAAEQCVLGGMMLSKDAISDVLEVIRPEDHYRPAHQIVHEVVLDLYARGEPADAITVAAELTKRGDIGRMGGAPYLHTLIASVPTAANAGYYARIVRERAILRRLVEVGTRIVQLGYSGDADADELVDRAEAEVYGVTEKRVGEDFLPLSEIMAGALDEIEAIGSRGGGLTGVPTGFADLDALTNGLHPGQMIVIAARPALGKALALDTPLPTPAGWTTMGDVQAGDWLLGADGAPVQVTAATAVLTGRPCYKVVFDGGATVTADAQHGWLTETRPAEARLAAELMAAAAAGIQRTARPARTAGESSVKTTRQIAATLRTGGAGRQLNHSVPLAAALDLPAADLALPPYLLGMWLGGAPAAGAPDRNPAAAAAVLGNAGLLAGQHIPACYLRASQDQRRMLLAGLLDAAGTVSPGGAVQLAVACRRLAADIRELLTGLGYRCGWRERAAGSAGAAGIAGCTVPGCTVPGSAVSGSRTRYSRTACRRGQEAGGFLIRFTTSDDVFRAPRKQALHRQRRPSATPAPRLHITAVLPVASVPVRCVQVDSPDHLYLAGRAMIPTHNSTLALDLARAASVKNGLTSVIFSLEMSRNEITMRLLSAEARIPLHSMRTGQMSEEDWTRLARRMSEVVTAPLFIDDSPNMSMMEIRAKCRRLKQRHDLRLVIIDYLQLMSSPKRVENRQQEVSEMSRSLKLLAKELNVPVIAVAQLNRGPEQRTDKRPMLSDLRESGCLTADTTLLRADTGAPVTLRELLDGGHADVLVWSIDEQQRIVAAPVTNVFPAGIKETYRLKLASGREVSASGNHPFLTAAGWRPLDALAAGNRVAIPGRVPAPVGAGLGWTEDRLGLLAHLIGGGRVIGGQPACYASNDEASLDFVEDAAAAEFGITPRRVQQKNWWRTYLPAPYRCTDGRSNPVNEWFRELGIEDLRSYEKRIPAILYSASDREIALFLRHLWGADGSARPGGSSAPKACYAASGRALADGVARLLARLGIIARIRRTEEADHRPGYHVIIAGGPSLRILRHQVGVHGRRGVIPEELAASLEAADTSDIFAATTSDICWDRIVSIDPLGPHPVYDATVKETHNFIADGIFAHNSIEQDADMVILLHREDAYERESPRAGEADFIVAKHRNGPTANVTVAFQGHYSRFVDMAPS